MIEKKKTRIIISLSFFFFNHFRVLNEIVFNMIIIKAGFFFKLEKISWLLSKGYFLLPIIWY